MSDIILGVMLLIGIINLFFDLSKYLLVLNIVFMIFIFIRSAYFCKINRVLHAGYGYYLLYYCLPVVLINNILFGLMVLEIKMIKYVYIVFILISIIIFIVFKKKTKNRIY